MMRRSSVLCDLACCFGLLAAWSGCESPQPGGVVAKSANQNPRADSQPGSRANHRPSSTSQSDPSKAGMVVLPHKGAKTIMLELGGGVKMELIRIPAGSFMMGSTEEERGEYSSCLQEEPRHQVRISRPFYMGRYLVTRGQFGRFVAATGYRTDAETRPVKAFKDGKKGGLAMQPYRGTEWREDASWRNPGFEQTDEHPVVMVSWNDAKAFCRWLSWKAGEGVRLPTEAEWEYACRAGTQTRFWWGSEYDTTGKVANLLDRQFKSVCNDKVDERYLQLDDGYPFTSPVGHYRPNGFGLCDMIGNVWEWCEDWFLGYEARAQVDPKGPLWGEARVIRGGCFCERPPDCRSAMRGYMPPDGRSAAGGFRVVAQRWWEAI